MTLAENIAHELGKGKVRKNRDGWLTCCPVHGDEKPSLSIKNSTDSNGNPDIIVNCHAGCVFETVKDEIRARGLLDDWKPGLESQQPIHNSRVTIEGTEKNNLPAFIWSKSKKDQEAAEIIRKAFAFRGIDLEQIPPNMRLNEYQGKRSIVCVMQHPLETEAAEAPEAVHKTLLDDEGRKYDTQYHGQKKGRAVLLYNDENRLVIGEGLETTLSATQATGYSGMVCGDAGNMAGMAKLPERFREIFILVDSDTTFTGQRAALEAAESIAQANSGASVFLVPPDTSCFTDQPLKKDFNDLSAEVIQERFAQAVEVSSERVEQLTASMEWKDPLPIKDELPQVEPMREDMIPDAFREWVIDAADRMQVPVDYLAVPLLVVCSSVVGTSCRIRPKQLDDWSVVPNLWGGIVGPPSMMKSPALDETVNKTLGRLEAEAGREFQKAQDEYAIKEMIAAAEQKKLKDEITKAVKTRKAGEDTGRTPAELAAELQKTRTGKPVERRYKTNDSSIEKIVELLRDNPRGLLYFRDELIALFRRMERVGNEQDRAFMLEAWSGHGNHTDDRIGRGTVRAENLCVSLLGSIQPDKIAEYLNRAVANGENDGFVQRLQLMVYPDPVKNWQYIDRLPDIEAKNRGYKVIEALAGLAVIPSEITDEKPFLHFSKEGQAIFKEWLTRLQLEKLEDENDHPIILEHLAKYRSLMPSLALIFHLIECVDKGRTPDPISQEAAETAAQWCNYLESHARRIYSLATNTGKRGGETLAKKIKSKTLKDGFKLRDIQMKKWSLLSSRESIQDALDWLAEKHWIQETEPERSTAQGGRPPACSYRINPKIFSL